jgi:hypothetical protein
VPNLLGLAFAPLFQILLLAERQQLFVIPTLVFALEFVAWVSLCLPSTSNCVGVFLIQILSITLTSMENLRLTSRSSHTDFFYILDSCVSFKSLYSAFIDILEVIDLNSFIFQLVFIITFLQAEKAVLLADLALLVVSLRVRVFSVSRG